MIFKTTVKPDRSCKRHSSYIFIFPTIYFHSSARAIVKRNFIDYVAANKKSRLVNNLSDEERGLSDDGGIATPHTFHWLIFTMVIILQRVQTFGSILL
jgi:hypothetical protein